MENLFFSQRADEAPIFWWITSYEDLVKSKEFKILCVPQATTDTRIEVLVKSNTWTIFKVVFIWLIGDCDNAKFDYASQYYGNIIMVDTEWAAPITTTQKCRISHDLIDNFEWETINAEQFVWVKWFYISAEFKDKLQDAILLWDFKVVKYWNYPDEGWLLITWSFDFPDDTIFWDNIVFNSTHNDRMSFGANCKFGKNCILPDNAKYSSGSLFGDNIIFWDNSEMYYSEGETKIWKNAKIWKWSLLHSNIEFAWNAEIWEYCEIKWNIIFKWFTKIWKKTKLFDDIDFNWWVYFDDDVVTHWTLNFKNKGDVSYWKEVKHYGDILYDASYTKRQKAIIKMRYWWSRSHKYRRNKVS